MTSFSFTASTIRSAIRAAPAGKVTTLRDSVMRGLILRGGTKGWAWAFEKKIDNTLHRATLGKLNETRDIPAAIDAMREAAASRAAAIRRGDDPDRAKTDERVREAMRQPARYWLDRWGKLVRPATKRDIESTLRLLGLIDKPLLALTRDDITVLYENQRTVVSERTGKPLSVSTIGKQFRGVRSLHYYATASFPEGATPPPNPVATALKGGRGHANKLFPGVRKSSLIDAAMLPAFVAELRRREAAAGTGLGVRWQAAQALALTGLRLREVTDLPWADVDLDAGTFTITAGRSKNHEALTRHITPALADIFARRMADKRRDADFVFESATKPGVPIWGAADEVRAAAVAVGAGPRSPHDLRRSYVSIARALGVAPSVRKLLVNHKSGGDVHDGYDVISADELRAASMQIEVAIVSVGQ